MWLVGWLVFGSARNDEQLLLADSAVVVPTQAQMWEGGGNGELWNTDNKDQSKAPSFLYYLFLSKHIIKLLLLINSRVLVIIAAVTTNSGAVAD